METETTSTNGADDIATPDGAPSDARTPDCTPAHTYDNITRVLRAIQQERGRPLFVIASHSIDDRDCAQVYSWRNELRALGKSGPLDILIHSPGGILTACYRIARLFARYSDSWTALVPQMAASGATIICLGSSKLIMSSFGQLGPVDPQVVSRRQQRFFSSERQSPLEAFQAVKYLREFALTVLDAYMRFLLDNGVAPETALKTAGSISAQLVSPILDNIEPYDLGSFALDSSLSVQYCRRICKPDAESISAQENVDYERLAEDYPAHEFVIDIMEAASLGFKVEEPNKVLEDHFADAGPELEKAHRYIGFVPDDGVQREGGDDGHNGR